MKIAIGVGVLVLAVPLLVAWGMRGPGSLKTEFDRELAVRMRAVDRADQRPVTDDDLARLPASVAGYLRAAGVVGKPRPGYYVLAFTGRIRGAPDEPWMPFRAEQYSSVDEPVRLFYMQARRAGIPVAVLHRYVSGHATMRVRLAGVWPMVNAAGPVMDRSETVTVFNDMCLLAPGTLLDPRIVWRERDAHSADATFTAGGQTIAATLTFGAAGLLTNFESHDRSRSSSDGRSFTSLPFVTPVAEHGTFASVRVARQAQAQWRMPDGELFTYAEFTLQSISFSAAGATRRSGTAASDET